MALTDTGVRKIKAKSNAYRLSDGGGLYLWVTPAGGKLWRWKYRHEGKEKLMSFGSYPDVSLSLARERHAEARKLLATGIDPMAKRKAEKAQAENSFQSIALRWLEHWRHGKSPRPLAGPRTGECSNLAFHKIQLIQGQIMRQAASLGAIQFEQTCNVVQVKSEGLRPLDEPDTLHIGWAIFPIPRRRPFRLG